MHHSLPVIRLMTLSAHSDKNGEYLRVIQVECGQSFHEKSQYLDCQVVPCTRMEHIAINGQSVESA